MHVSGKYFAIILVTLGFIDIVHPHSEEKRLLLENEPNVDLDGELGQLRTQLLDQQRLINALQQTAATQNDLEALQNDLELQKNITAALKQQETATKQKDLELQKNITALQQENEQLKVVQQGRGSVYVRWGRNVCPSTTSLVYTGFTAGNFYNEAGSGSDNLCLPADPTWSKYRDGASSEYRANVYGTEIDTIDSDHIFNYPVNEQDIPCVVCRSSKPTNVMIPARNNCYPGWTEEYHGYLMASFHGHKATSTNICVDENPEFINGGRTNNDQHILYLVQGQCGSLPCPPYVNGRELACVVCSK